MPIQYPIRNIDSLEALVLETPSSYGVKAAIEDKVSGYQEFIYCYTALTSLRKGSCVCISLDSGDAAGQNPRAVLPATSAVPNQFGICAETIAVAGGIWVQVYGRCPHAIVDGTTDVGINDPLKPVNGAHNLVIDHTDTGTASMVAFAEEAETSTLTVQGDATYGLSDNTVFLLNRLATVA
jgi:hypothetical protein